MRYARIGVVCGLASLGILAQPAVLVGHAGQVMASPRLDALPLSLQPNRGQWPSTVRFGAHGDGYSLYLTATQMVLVESVPRANARLFSSRASRRMPRARPAVVHIDLIGADAHSRVKATGRLAGRVSYFLGNDPHRWQADIPTYSRVEYRGVYPGVDLRFTAGPSGLEYSWFLRSGADASHIRLRLDRSAGARLDRQGDLVLTTAAGSLIQRAPVSYLLLRGHGRPVASRFVLDGRVLSLRLARHDAHRPLIIDPILRYSTFLGGGEGDSEGNAIAVDAGGDIVVAGDANADGFPTYNAQSGYRDGSDVVVAKLDPRNATVLYSTYLGGPDDDFAYGLALDAQGDAYLTGSAGDGFPVAHALQPDSGGRADAFVTELNPTGSTLIYSTYLGGSLSDVGNLITVDRDGGAVVTGATSSEDFPTVDALQSHYGGGPSDAFVARLSPDGRSLTYSTFLGGSGSDRGVGVALDAAGNIYVAGATDSPNFPVANAFQPHRGSGKTCPDALTRATPCTDAFVMKIDAGGQRLRYSTYLGGKRNDQANDIAVDDSGAVVVTGYTSSRSFPILHAVQRRYGGGTSDAFVTSLSPSGALVYSTYLGGRDGDVGAEIGLAAGTAYVVGFTSSRNLKTSHPLQRRYGGGASDAFFAAFRANGALDSSTYFGGKDIDLGWSVVVAPDGTAYISGSTGSRNLPIVGGAQRTYRGGSWEVFVAELARGEEILPSPVPTTTCPAVSWKAGHALARRGTCSVIGGT